MSPSVEFKITDKSNEATVNIFPIESTGDMVFYKITVDYPQTTIPQSITIEWYLPFVDCFSRWCPVIGVNRDLWPEWRPYKNISFTNTNAPIYTVIAKNSNNRYTFAVSDLENPISIHTGSDSCENAVLYTKLELFCRPMEALRHYETLLLIDRTDRPYYESIYAVRTWWKELGYTACNTPPEAKRALYSTWYAYLTEITEQDVIKQCLAAKEFGLDTVIIDDGWQFDSKSKDSIYAGNWGPFAPKFSDMRKLADKIHSMGMKCLLWFPIAYYSKDSVPHKLFSNKTLGPWAASSKNLLFDPRFKEQREWLVELFVKTIRDWDFDGLKLDYIDAFIRTDVSSKAYDEMDHPKLEDAINVLLEEILTETKKFKPDILIEYREFYHGPSMQRFGNIFRVGDCAGAAMVNRIHSIDNRLIAGDSSAMDTVAVHSDMIVWDTDAPAEAAADQLSSCLFCVPQISVRLTDLNDDQAKMLRHYLSFIDNNRDILLEGKLMPLSPEANYATVIAQRDNRVIAALYETLLFVVPENTAELTVVNATGNNYIYIDAENSVCDKAYAVTNCKGEKTASGILKAKEISKISVPHNGFFTVK